MPLLTAAAAAIGGAVLLEPKSGWREGTNLYAGVIGEPGSRKTPAAKVALQAVWHRQNQLEDNYRQLETAYVQALAKWESARKDERGDKPQPPAHGHVVSTDATTEVLAPMLLSAKGILVAKDELAGLVRGMDQYRSGKGADRQNYLSMWSREPIKVDRKGNPRPILVEHPHLSVVGGIQPDMLPELADAAQREDGFLDRLLWSYPDRVPDHWTTEGISEQTAWAVVHVFDRLYAIRAVDGLSGEPVSVVVRFDDLAKQLWVDWYERHAGEMASEELAPRLRGPWAKMPSQLCRLALILHCCATDPISETLGADTLLAAIGLVAYFKSHARRVYRQLGKQRRDRAVVILEALKREGPMTQYEIQCQVFKNNASGGWLRETLENLVDAGLVTKEERRPKTGHPATVWRLA